MTLGTREEKRSVWILRSRGLYTLGEGGFSGRRKFWSYWDFRVGGIFQELMRELISTRLEPLLVGRLSLLLVGERRRVARFGGVSLPTRGHSASCIVGCLKTVTRVSIFEFYCRAVVLLGSARAARERTGALATRVRERADAAVTLWGRVLPKQTCIHVLNFRLPSERFPTIEHFPLRLAYLNIIINYYDPANAVRRSSREWRKRGVLRT
jgi:hypothetical protein